MGQRGRDLRIMTVIRHSISLNEYLVLGDLDYSLIFTFIPFLFIVMIGYFPY